MKTTGIIRRIDDLGRVVIPKELRRTMRFREGEELEIAVGSDGLILRKYSALDGFSDFVPDYGEAMSRALNCEVVITDNEKIIYPVKSDENADRELTDEFRKLLEERRPRRLTADACLLISANSIKPYEQLITPLIAAGDLYGAVVINSDSELTDTERKAAETAAYFLVGQIGE